MTSPTRQHEVTRTDHPADPATSPPGGQRQALAVAVVVTTVLVLLIVAGAALTGGWSTHPAPVPIASIEPIPTLTEPSAEPTPEEPVPQPPNQTVQRALTTVLAAAGALLAAFLVYRIALWVRRTLLPWLAAQRDRPAPVAPGADLQLDAVPLTELRSATAHAETLLRNGGCSPDAIIAAWLALEEAAGRSGATRAPAQTPTEFTVEVLAATPATPAAVTELLGLFHLARFARTEMTAAHITAATAALRQLTDDFTRTDDDATETTP